jgi:hypothetical protein
MTTNIGAGTVNDWKDKTIVINDSWGAGAANVLRSPLGGKAELALRARHLRHASGERPIAQFEAEVSSGYLTDGWHRAVLTPLGTQPVQGIQGLPAWDGSPAVQATYRKMIDDPKNNLMKPGTQRLETVIPFVAQNGDIGYDNVRLFYVVNAVTGGGTADLVVFTIQTHVGVAGLVQAQQGGTGQGPPH